MRIYGRRVRTSNLVFIHTYRRGGFNTWRRGAPGIAIKAGRDRESFVIVVVIIVIALEPDLTSRRTRYRTQMMYKTSDVCLNGKTRRQKTGRRRILTVVIYARATSFATLRALRNRGTYCSVLRILS